MKNNDALKKHHFWILLGLVPLLVLIAVLVISSGVGGAITAKQGEVDKAKSDIASKTNVKPKALIEAMDVMTKKVDARKGDLHKVNWDRQQPLYTWPNSHRDRLKAIERMGLKFGDPIPNNNEQYAEFPKKEVYIAEYSAAGLPKEKLLVPGALGMADRVAPTQFAGGWASVLRHVNNWGDAALNSNQIWLLMEDIWVQRSLLEAVKSVNDQMAAFERVQYKKDGVVIDDPNPEASQKDPLRRKFKSRTWEVALEVVRKGNRQYLVGSLKNTTDRLQLLGAGKTMTLKVWLERNKDGKTDGIEPVEFKIGGEFLPGEGITKTVKDKEGKEKVVPANVAVVEPDETNDKSLDAYPNLIPPGKTAAEIVKVEQVFDTQTVPVRQIVALALGKTDSRNAAMSELAPPKFLEKEFAAAAAGTPSTTESPGLSLGSAGGPPPILGGKFPPGIAGPGGESSSSATGGRSGGGSIEAVVNANKRRYIATTDQVRRMPVGIVVIVDQAQLQDVLLAFANSPLRFQITQVTWTRYRRDLGTGTGLGSAGGSDTIITGGSSGQFGSGFGIGSDPDARPPGGGSGFGPPRPPGGIGPFPGGGSGLGPPPGLVPPGGMGSGMVPPGVGGSPGSFGFGPGSGTMTTVSDAQITSGLIELSVYGIVSLYEKYVSPEEAAAKEAKDKETKEQPKDEKKDDKKDDKKDPMTPAPTTPKMRTRRRAG
jgi:hypothetical protein